MAKQQNEGESDLLDDSFADLPADALDALEQNAVRSTQQAGPRVTLTHPQHLHQTLPTLPLPASRSNAQVQDSACGREYFTNGPSSDYGVFDEEVLDAELIDHVDPSATVRELHDTAGDNFAGEVTQREQWRKERFQDQPRLFAHHSHQPGRSKETSIASLNPNRSSVQPQDLENEDEMHDAPYHEESDPREGNGDAATALQARIQELLLERDNLQKSLSDEKSTVLSKAGEMSIVRINQAKSAKEYERKIITLQKLHADEAARQKTDLQRATAEGERIATENKFLKRDLTEEGEKIRNLKRSMKDSESMDVRKEIHNDSPVWTPRKGRGLPYRDGFDDDEIVLSPPKPQSGRSKAATPKAGVKRKRKPATDSPTQALELSQGRREGELDTATPKGTDFNAVSIPKLARANGAFEFLQTILNHRPDPEAARTIESFTQYALPSKPQTSFSSIVLDRLSSHSINSTARDIPAEFCNTLCSLWVDCLNEKHYPPINVIIEFLTFVLALDTTSIASRLIDDLLPLIQATADVNVIPRFQRAPMSEMNDKVDVTVCISLLHLVALSCAQHDVDIQRFWRLVRYDLILMMLRPPQPLDQILIIIDLLGTSILSSTLGSIRGNDGEAQRETEEHVLERLSALLVETLRARSENETYPRSEVAELRLEVLRLLSSIACNKHGGGAMAAHPSVIRRLVKTMSDELEALYDHRAGHEASAALVNLATRILHHLVTKYPSVVDLHTRLAALPGGTHRHLVTLTRLAFSEGLVLEAGIEDEVVECAHHMLEECVTPEEGEALLGAFASGRS